MNWTIPTTPTLISAGAAFVLVVAVTGLAAVLVSQRTARAEQRIKARLDPKQELRGGQRTLRLWHEGEQATVQVAQEYGAGSLMERLHWIGVDAGFRTPLPSILVLVLAAALGVGAVTFVFTGSLISALGLAALPGVAFWMYLGRRTTKRTALFERQLVDGLELSARALRAGHPMLGSFQLIAEEIPEPVGRVFGDICQQHQMGISLEQSLARTALVSRNPDMRLFSASLAIQIRTGGNLADVVEGIAAVIRQRMRLNRRFRVLTAQTQLSKRVLLAMPLLVFGALQIISPTYLDPLFDSRSGNVLLAIATGGLLMGWYVMNRMASLES